MNNQIDHYVPEMWHDTVEIINSILQRMLFHGLLLNERYLHHSFSKLIHCVHPTALDLFAEASLLRLHPEWPTYKEATGIDFGKYREVDKQYVAVDTGKKGGFIDFALGPYLAPPVAVEFKLLFGWQGEAVAFDYMKLLDGRNPFRAVVQVTVLMRPNGLVAAGRKEAIRCAMNTAYMEAVTRLERNDCTRPVATRRHRFIITELGPLERRHWLHCIEGGEFSETSDPLPVPE